MPGSYKVHNIIYPKIPIRKPITGMFNPRPANTKKLAAAFSDIYDEIKEMRHQIIIQAGKGEIEIPPVRKIQNYNLLLCFMQRTIDYHAKGGNKVNKGKGKKPVSRGRHEI